MPDAATIEANLASLRARIAKAAKAAGRKAEEITLIAVSKTNPPAAVAAAAAAGQSVFGENRVQEAATKFPYPGARLHLIGPLQTNKVAAALAVADVIETLDRARLADALIRGFEAGRTPDLLVQVNIGDEPQKAGVARAEADRFIRDCRARFGRHLTGLMCIPPAGADPAPFFLALAAMADEHGLAVRSMGMSGDFEAAIAAGATHVRLGSAIFGARAVTSET